MKCATPTANTTRRVVPRETRIGSDLATLVTCMPGGYRAWCIRATFRWLVTSWERRSRRSWSVFLRSPVRLRP